MSRYIDTDVLKDAVRNYFINFVSDGSRDWDAVKANAELQELIDGLADETWTMAEYPPDDGRYVLLSFENFTLPMVGRYEEYTDGCGNYYLGDCDEEDTCLASDLIVNAWMELPEPYKPKEM